MNVIRDLDGPEKGYAGERHAAAVVASLRRHGIEATLLEPREGKDVSDHLAAGHSWMALVEVDRTRPSQCPTKTLLGKARIPQGI